MRALLVLAPLLLLTVFSGLSPPAAADDCVPVETPGLGPACRHPNGLFEVFDREGRSLGLTHGVDPAPSGGGDAQVTPQAPACVENDNMTPDGELASPQRYFIVVIYAMASNSVDRYSTQAPLIRGYVEEAQGFLSESADAFGRSVLLRVACTNGFMKVWNVRLGTTLGQTTFSSIKQDLADAGFTDPRVKLWVWFDGLINCGCAGIGNIHDDSRFDPDNANNGNGISTGVLLLPDAAVSFRQEGGFVLAHEIAHTLGAVQLDAPSTSGAFHCNEGKDVMCYADGGPESHYNDVFCSTQVFHCNHNDYFHPDPLDGSYLATHWNVGHPFNRYIEGCFDLWGRLQAGMPGTFVSVAGVNSRLSDLPLACRGHRFGVQAIPHDLVEPDQFLNDAPATATHDFDVCWWNGPAFLGCNDTIVGNGWEEGRVPSGATRFEVRLRVGAAVDYLFRVI